MGLWNDLVKGFKGTPVELPDNGDVEPSEDTGLYVEMVNGLGQKAWQPRLPDGRKLYQDHWNSNRWAKSPYKALVEGSGLNESPYLATSPEEADKISRNKLKQSAKNTWQENK